MKREVSVRAFDGFGPELFDFYEQLAGQQSREWFQENKAQYEEGVLVPLRQLIWCTQPGVRAAEASACGGIRNGRSSEFIVMCDSRRIRGRSRSTRH